MGRRWEPPERASLRREDEDDLAVADVEALARVAAFAKAEHDAAVAAHAAADDLTGPTGLRARIAEETAWRESQPTMPVASEPEAAAPEPQGPAYSAPPRDEDLALPPAEPARAQLLPIHAANATWQAADAVEELATPAPESVEVLQNDQPTETEPAEQSIEPTSEASPNVRIPVMLEPVTVLHFDPEPNPDIARNVTPAAEQPRIEEPEPEPQQPPEATGPGDEDRHGDEDRPGDEDRHHDDAEPPSAPPPTSWVPDFVPEFEPEESLARERELVGALMTACAFVGGWTRYGVVVVLAACAAATRAGRDGVARSAQAAGHGAGSLVVRLVRATLAAISGVARMLGGLAHWLVMRYRKPLVTAMETLEHRRTQNLATHNPTVNRIVAHSQPQRDRPFTAAPAAQQRSLRYRGAVTATH